MAEFTLGVDVSAAQGPVDWAAVKGDGVAFAFIKATEGGSFTSHTWRSNWLGAGEAGLPRGAYHFFRSAVDARTQARHFLREVAADPGELAPVLDVEAVDGVPNSQIVQGAREWLQVVADAVQRRPLVYCSPGFAEAHLGAALAEYPLWVAHYGVAAPRVPAGWADWTFWQHTDRGKIAGIKHFVDLNHFHGTVEQLGGTGAKPAPRLIAAIRRNGDWNYFPIPAAFADDAFTVRSVDLTAALQLPGGTGVAQPLRDALVALGWTADFATDHLNDARDPRVYVFVTAT